jgi:Zn-dependent M28 family amino/carboxypeptidase
MGENFVNISVEIPGREHDDEIVVIGAHYDTHKDSPGANDNGSAVAALLELARCFVAPADGAHVTFCRFHQ